MDTLLPKERNGSDAFPLNVPDGLRPNSVHDKAFPEKEIRDILLTHTVTKANLRRVRESVYRKWVQTTTNVIYTSVYGSPQVEADPVEATMRARYICTKLSATGTSWWGVFPTGYVLNAIQMLLEDASWSLGQVQHQSAIDFLHEGDDEAHLECMEAKRQTHIWDVIFERCGNLAKPEEMYKLQLLQEAWERAISRTNSLDVASWFSWLHDHNADIGSSRHVITLSDGQKIHFPSRKHIVLDWMLDAHTPCELVTQVSRWLGEGGG